VFLARVTQRTEQMSKIDPLLTVDLCDLGFFHCMIYISGMGKAMGWLAYIGIVSVCI
jgi:hypothetical protein